MCVCVCVGVGFWCNYHIILFTQGYKIDIVKKVWARIQQTLTQTRDYFHTKVDNNNNNNRSGLKLPFYYWNERGFQFFFNLVGGELGTFWIWVFSMCSHPTHNHFFFNDFPNLFPNPFPVWACFIPYPLPKVLPFKTYVARPKRRIMVYFILRVFKVWVFFF